MKKHNREIHFDSLARASLKGRIQIQNKKYKIQMTTWHEPLLKEERRRSSFTLPPPLVQLLGFPLKLAFSLHIY